MNEDSPQIEAALNRMCGKVLEQAHQDIYSSEVEWREVPEFNEEDLPK